MYYSDAAMFQKNVRDMARMGQIGSRFVKSAANPWWTLIMTGRM